MDNPCKGCEERTAYCHADCERYARYARELADTREKKRARKEIEYAIWETLIRTSETLRKKNHRQR